MLRAVFPPAKVVQKTNHRGGIKRQRPLELEEAEEILHCRMGMVMAIAMYTSSPQRYKFVQSCIGVEMWRQGCSQKTFSTLNKFGVSQGHCAAISHVDIISKHHADQICAWKSSIEEGQTSAAGYSLGWDNVQQKSEARHQGIGAGRENRFLLWGMCFGAENRVRTMHLDNTVTKNVAEISPNSILPSPQDYAALSNRMVILVERILVDYFSVLDCININPHITHIHSGNMRKTSNVLGVVNADPSSTEGCSKIMKFLQQYVPCKESDLVTLMCHGDNGSVERMRGSHRATVNVLTNIGRLEGLEECPQEFHKEALLLQDYMNSLYSAHSLSARGTLSQLKVEFGHRALKTKVMDNFKHCWDMMQFMTEAYVVMLAMKVLDMKSLDDVPYTYPSDESTNKKKEWLNKLAMDIVDRCWCVLPSEDIRAVTRSYENAQRNEEKSQHNDEDTFSFCLPDCKSEKEEDMILCCSAECSQEWYHLSCVRLCQLPPSDEDWYCSTECENSLTYIYCICKRKNPSLQMVQCHLESACRRKEWYHLKCLGLKNSELPDTWYCSEDCMLGAEDDDCVLNYSRKVVWEGLNLMVRRDAVREGDGPTIMSHWKLDMVQFWNLHHYKYFHSGCQMLTNLAGFLPERLQQDILWNRLINVKGKTGGNIGMDLMNEFLNNDFKEMLKRSRGQYTEKQIQRVSRMSGAFGRQLDSMFTESGLGYLNVANYHEKPSWLKQDVQKFVMDFQDDALFDYCPPRSHRGFDGLKNSRNIQSTNKMGQKLQEITSDMQLWRNLRHRDD